MASALLQLAGLVDEPDKTRYRNFALEILKSLASPAYAAAQGQNSHFLLMHSVGHLPNNSEIDVAINYADYYYLEALLRCRALVEN
jgi:unsaturated chondroitin disaccharide hydrolase